MKIMRAWDSGRNKVRYIYKDEYQKVKIGEQKVEWFFYVRNSDFDSRKAIFRHFQENGIINKTHRESHYTRLYVDRIHNNELLDKNMEYVWEYRDKKLNYILKVLDEKDIPHYEADLRVYQRWMVSEDIEIEDNYRVAMFDIETDDEKISGKPIPGEFQILSFALIDADTGKGVWLKAADRTDEAERDLLVKMLKYFNQYDVICAWNGAYFDFPYVKVRCQYHGLTYDWRKKFFQDHLERTRKLGPSLPSYSLEYVAQHFLKEGKVDRNERIIDLFRDDPAKLKKYNVRDAVLMKRIEEKTKFLSVARSINVIGRCFVDDIYISRKVDMLVLKKAYEREHYHFRTKVKKEEKSEDEEKFAGAYVFEPVLGLHHDVSVFDVGSLYPNIIKTFHVSPDALITDENRNEVPKDQIIRTPNGQFFRKDIKGILAEVVEIIVEGRNKYKALMKTVSADSTEHKTYDSLQYAYKSFGLSFYGVTGNQFARFYDTRISESITLTGQHFIKNIAEFLTQKGNTPIYGDTDSNFVKLKDRSKVNELLKEIKEFCLNLAKKFGCDTCSIEMAHDKRFQSFLLVAKKNYAGWMDFVDGKYIDPPVMYIAGLECKRTDKARLVVQQQMDVLKKMLSKEGFDLENTIKFVEQLKERVINNRDIKIEEIQIAQKLTKEVEEYKANSMHLRVVEEMEKEGKAVYVGDKIEYYIYSVDAEGKPVPRHVSKFDGSYAKIYYWNNVIYPPIKRVVSVVYPDYNWERFLVSKKKARSAGYTGRTDLW